MATVERSSGGYFVLREGAKRPEAVSGEALLNAMTYAGLTARQMRETEASLLAGGRWIDNGTGNEYRYYDGQYQVRYGDNVHYSPIDADAVAALCRHYGEDPAYRMQEMRSGQVVEIGNTVAMYLRWSTLAPRSGTAGDACNQHCVPDVGIS